MTTNTIPYADATPEQQAQAQEELRNSSCYPYDEWWDSAYEDFKRIAGCMGIDVDEVHFSGFWSQGDGACFTGTWGMPTEGSIVKNIRAYCQDEELIRIARELWDAQRRNFYGLSAKITQRGRYYHEHTMYFDIENNRKNGWDNGVDQKYEDQITEAMRDLAQWLYATLETEYEYLMSDECLHECLLANDAEIEVELDAEEN